MVLALVWAKLLYNGIFTYNLRTIFSLNLQTVHNSWKKGLFISRELVWGSRTVKWNGWFDCDRNSLISCSTSHDTLYRAHYTALCSKVKLNLKGLSPSIVFQILSFVTKTSCSWKFGRFPTRKSGVSGTQKALQNLNLNFDLI